MVSLFLRHEVQFFRDSAGILVSLCEKRHIHLQWAKCGKYSTGDPIVHGIKKTVCRTWGICGAQRRPGAFLSSEYADMYEAADQHPLSCLRISVYGQAGRKKDSLIRRRSGRAGLLYAIPKRYALHDGCGFW